MTYKMCGYAASLRHVRRADRLIQCNTGHVDHSQDMATEVR
jgi:hypothetical protein